MFPALITAVFGIETASKIYSLSFFAFVFASLFQFGFVYFLEDLIGFDSIFYIFLGMTAVAFSILLKFDPKPINQSK